LTIKSILRCFELISGLKVNVFKSRLVGLNIPNDLLASLAHFLNCCFGSLPFPFLGIPLGGNSRSPGIWTPVIEKYLGKLSCGRCRFLSSRSRITLLKSILLSLPIFFLSFFKIPNSVLISINKIMRKFSWEGTREGRSIHWVGWEKIFLPKIMGDLGIRDLELFNAGLLAKMEMENINGIYDNLWCKILTSRYGNIPFLKVKIQLNVWRNCSSWWRDIWKSCVLWIRFMITWPAITYRHRYDVAQPIYHSDYQMGHKTTYMVQYRLWIRRR
jgi:hypothetical protein